MSNKVTIAQQQQQGLRPVRAQPINYTPAYGPYDITTQDQNVLSGAVNAAGEMMTHRQISHMARTDDTAISGAVASLLYSAAYGIAAAMITGGIILFGWMIAGGSGKYWALAWLVIWGLCLLGSLAVNRYQGQWFSSAGIAHHEIQSRERIAMHVVDKHMALLEKRWKLGK